MQYIGCLGSVLILSIGIAIFLSEHVYLGLAIIVGSLIFFSKVEKHRQNSRKVEKEIKYTSLVDRLKNRVREWGFNSSQIFQDQSGAGDKFIVLDELKKKILFVNASDYRVYDYKDILKSTVYEDGNEVMNSARSTATTGAVVGAALGGGVGAVIGGLVGESQGNHGESVQVKVVVNDTQSPSQTIDFLYLDKEGGELHIYKKDNRYLNALNNARNFHDKISILIRQADELEEEKVEFKQASKNTINLREDTIAQQDFDTQKNNTLSNNSTMAVELEQLHKLVEKGILTQEEFEMKKKQMLKIE